MQIAYKTILLLLLCFGYGCGETQHDISFYHWKSSFDLNNFEKDYLAKSGSKKIYLRFFDVKWLPAENRAIPVAQLQYKDPNLLGIEIIPVTYITNEALLKSKDTQALAQQLVQKFKQQLGQIDQRKYPIHEIQIDCDWTLSSMKKYFHLLEQLREAFDDKQLSATIRLHQIKYFQKTGVPPIDKGVLMFYNMGKLTDTSETNSILNLETAKKYLHNFDNYPLPIDIALPLFSWGIQFRNGKTVLLLNGIRAADLLENDKIEVLANNQFRITKSHFLNGSYIYKGDQIRTEEVNMDQLRAATKLLANEMRGRSYDYILYHLDEAVLRHYSVENLREL